MWSRSELESELGEAGLGEWASRLAQLARPCVILVPGPLEGAADAPLGATRLGGSPDLPPDIDWPSRPPFTPERASVYDGPVPGWIMLGRHHWLHRLLRTAKWKEAARKWERYGWIERQIRSREWPLHFVAQIDLAEVHAACPLDGFPATGRLLFFCDAEDWPWGKREDQARVRVLFLEQAADTLQRRLPPPELDGPEAKELLRRGTFGQRTLRPDPWLLPPPLGSREVRALQEEAPADWEPSGPAFSAYDQFWDDLHAQHPDVFGAQGEMMHQVGGIASSIQEPVEAECASFAGDAPGMEDQWQLILQIDSDIELRMEWGDVGRFYICARKDDLVARRFDRAWTIMQCY